MEWVLYLFLVVAGAVLIFWALIFLALRVAIKAVQDSHAPSCMMDDEDIKTLK